MTDFEKFDALVRSRKSLRAFLPKPVPHEVLRRLLETASRSPSGTNMQPWQVYVVQGASRDNLINETCAAYDTLRLHPERAEEFGHAGDAADRKVGSPYLDRRRQNGWALYGLLGLTRENKDGMHQQQERNYRFFDAPVGLFFTTHVSMQGSSLVDFGLFMQTFMLAAKIQGLDTCAQGAWRNFSKIVMRHLKAGPEEVMVCGMALGYADVHALVNTLETPRESVDNFTRWLD